jgi:hypothetical protein
MNDFFPGTRVEQRRDLIDREFELLTVLDTLVRYSKLYQSNRLHLRVKCRCGRRKVVLASPVLDGTTISCGCEQKRRLLASLTKHGLKHTRLYQVWKNLRSRCNNENHPQWADWGGRGITVCPEWDDFQVFYDHCLSLLPAGSTDVPRGLLIDREKNDKGYYPGNVRFVDRQTQNRNRRSVQWITIDGVTKMLTEWLLAYGISAQAFYARRRRGMSVIEALTAPKKR